MQIFIVEESNGEQRVYLTPGAANARMNFLEETAGDAKMVEGELCNAKVVRETKKEGT